MRLYHLINLQHINLYIIPTLIFILLLGTALGFTHFRTKHSERRKNRIGYQYPDGISDKHSPFPVFLMLLIAGILLWGLGYILAIGFFEIRI
jgi:hypothetical protein